eukprot:237486_1
MDVENKLKHIQPMKLRLFKAPISDKLKIKVIGYPGEEKLRGQLYGMKGIGKVDYINDEIKYNKLIIYNDVDTTKGQSGSPIFECYEMDDEQQDNSNIFKSFGSIIGIHVVGTKKKVNYGTMINNGILQILQWIHKCIGGDCNKYDDCNVSVLLITSSKSRYESRLNEIYATCVRTQTMSIRRVYFDYDKEHMVSKKDFMFYLKTVLQTNTKKYLIFYC